MAKRLLLVMAVSALTFVGCNSGKESRVDGSSEAAAASDRDAIETALMNLKTWGIEGRVVRYDLNAAREGKKKRRMDDTSVAESYGKIGVADVVIVYNQTEQELRYGLARLYVAKGRDAEKDRFEVLVSQSYQIGQFVMDSTLLGSNYHDSLEEG